MNDSVELIFWRLGLAAFAASLGAGVSVFVKKISHGALCVLISIAAGALLAVSLFEILPESIRLAGIGGTAVAAVSGYFLFWFLTRFLFHVCPACAATHTEINFKAVSAAMLIAFGIHSFSDGLAIAGGYETEARVGFLILLGVVFHKFPEGLALGLVSRSSGFSLWDSFLLVCGIEIVTTFAGGIAGMLLSTHEMSHLGAYLLAHVAGGFIFLVTHALLGEALKKHPRSTVLAALGGAGVVLSAHFLFGS